MASMSVLQGGHAAVEPLRRPRMDISKGENRSSQGFAENFSSARLFSVACPCRQGGNSRVCNKSLISFLTTEEFDSHPDCLSEGRAVATSTGDSAA
eukprot:3437537-Pyramimonas_sp.AAC.1